MITDSQNNEFWYSVSNQSEIPIYGSINKDVNLENFTLIIEGLPDDSSTYLQYVKGIICSMPDYIDVLRTLVGVSDKRMYLELSYIFNKDRIDSDGLNIINESTYNLIRHSLPFFKSLLKSKNKLLQARSSELITEYLFEKGLNNILFALSKVDLQEVKLLIAKWILPKELQQAEAKHRGHGAEFELAKLVNKLGCITIPTNKHLNAMSENDPNVDGNTFEITGRNAGSTYAFDLIILDQTNTPRIYVQSLIHTSDPGQYGVNKSDETVAIKRALTSSNFNFETNKQLWGILDGVGFAENKVGTIDKLINEMDCFVQMKTLYKAALALHKLQLVKLKAIVFDNEFYTNEQIKMLFHKYGSADIELLATVPTSGSLIPVKAGKAIVYI